jgi:hypothetical protein
MYRTRSYPEGRLRLRFSELETLSEDESCGGKPQAGGENIRIQFVTTNPTNTKLRLHGLEMNL